MPPEVLRSAARYAGTYKVIEPARRKKRAKPGFARRDCSSAGWSLYRYLVVDDMWEAALEFGCVELAVLVGVALSKIAVRLAEALASALSTAPSLFLSSWLMLKPPD